MILAAIAATLIDSTVTFSAPAAPAAKVLPALSQQVGLRLEADRTAKAQVLLINVNQVPQDRLLQEIAKTTGAVWAPIQGGYRLTYETACFKKMWEEERATQVEWLRKATEAGTARLAQEGSIESQVRRGKTMRMIVTMDTPSGTSLGPPPRAGLLAAAKLGPEILADVRRGQRVVYSDHPNVNQRRLPSGFEETAKLICAESRTFQGAVSKSLDSQSFFSAQTPNGPTRTIVALSRAQGSNAICVQVIIHGANPTDQVRGKVLLKPPPSVANRSNAPLIEPSKEMKWVATGGHGSSPSPSMLKLFSQPERTDPLQMMVSPLAENYARTQSKGIVACLPDESLDVATKLSLKNYPQDAIATNAEALGVKVETSDEVLISPLHPTSMIDERTDRDELGKFIRSTSTNEGISIEAAGDFTATRPPGAIKRLPQIWLSSYSLEAGYQLEGQDYFAAGHLINLIRQFPASTYDGRQISFGELSVPQQNAFAAWIINPPITEEGGDFPFPPGSGLTDRSDIIVSPSSGGGVAVTLDTQPRIMNISSRTGEFVIENAADTAQHFYRSGKLDEAMTSQRKFRPASHRQLTIKVSVPYQIGEGKVGVLSYSATVFDELPVRGTTAGPYRNLPQDLLNQIERFSHISIGD